MIKLPLVSIVILHWNRFHETYECVRSLLKVTYKPLDIIVVDNGSTDDSMAKLSRLFNTVRFIYNKENLGFAGGNNVGIKFAMKCGADYVLVLNNDTIVSEDFLLKLIEVAESDSKIGALSPTIYNYSKGRKTRKIFYAGGHVSMWKGATIRYRLNEIDALNNKRTAVEVGFVSGCASLLRREALDEIGLFDEKFFFGVEDADLSWRLKKFSYSIIFVPDSKIWHKESKSRSFSDDEIYNGIVSKAILMQKHFPNSIFNILWVVYFVRTSLLLNKISKDMVAKYGLQSQRQKYLRIAIRKAIIRGFSKKVLSTFKIP